VRRPAARLHPRRHAVAGAGGLPPARREPAARGSRDRRRRGRSGRLPGGARCAAQPRPLVGPGRAARHRLSVRVRPRDERDPRRASRDRGAVSPAEGPGERYPRRPATQPFQPPRVSQGYPSPPFRSTVDESALIARVRAGDGAAERALYDTHVDRVYRLAYRLSGDDELAREFTQDTFVRAFERLGSFRGEARLSTWLYAITTSVVLNGLRKVKRFRRRETDLTEATGV